jgi:hypothetical protein
MKSVQSPRAAVFVRNHNQCRIASNTGWRAGASKRIQYFAKPFAEEGPVEGMLRSIIE